LALLYAVVIETPLVFVMQIDREISTSNYYSVQDLETGTANGGSPYYDLGLDGSGQIIGSCDSGLDMNSCYFEENSSNNKKVSRIYARYKYKFITSVYILFRYNFQAQLNLL
jgi:hypothetical protein